MSGADATARILAVDDDPVILRLLSRILTPAGYEVVEAQTARAARTLLATGRFSLLITDLNMPGESGLDLVRDLRGKNAEFPIVILSGSIEEKTRQEAEDLGRVVCLNKPLDHDRLLSVARDLIGTRDLR